MSSKRKLHLGLCALLSLVVTSVAHYIDSGLSSTHQNAEGVQWARQIVSQAEGMSLKARENGEKDPISWAVSYLAQGVEPRLIHVNKIKQPDSEQSSENYTLDRETGLFDYSKTLSSQDGAGIHVQLSLGYAGFLGARSALVSDLFALGLFLICSAVAFLLTGRYFGFDDTYRIRVLVSCWVGGAKSQLTRLSVHIREMVRQSQRLAACAGRARDLVSALRGKIHKGLGEMHESRQWFREAEAAAVRADGLALSAVIEANRIGGDATRIADMATEIHRSLETMRALNKKCSSLMTRMEKQMEPWATDADQAFHAFDEVKDATESLGRHIRATTETLIGQAKLIQNLHQELGEPSVSVVPVPSSEALAESSSAADTKQLPEPLPAIVEKKAEADLSLLRRLGLKKSA